MTIADERTALRNLVAGMAPFDEREANDRALVLAWIDRGGELYRRVPPDEPPQHLVTYFLPHDVGQDLLFLVAHRKAGRWLPPGGHVEPGETPWATVLREADEELAVIANPHPLIPAREPLFLTVTETVGPGQHTDCTLWFLIDLHPNDPMAPDPGEFSDAGWFPRTEVAGWPAERTDPQMARALAKLDAHIHAARAAGSGHAGR
ncbi:NUDIX domain-containing protein [Dactylosporangium sp. NPDC000555]|uniref:NUDIX domain-containing protein n=1 Tax=Dactylosporangium sp. NPDC000555 TaxID=3154260 RepID=UPI00331FF982